MAVPFLDLCWFTTSKYQKVGQHFYINFLSNFTLLSNLRQTTPGLGAGEDRDGNETMNSIIRSGLSTYPLDRASG